ncbi:MAG: bifunctional hydroxymethylpyrimidine kinase/phosphomethylpyrimidine kinase [Candidatus Bathyarchaeota archaeon]|nr:bifunctional hydroxymethylpyrimidine kinase/phosphomethylpyrimidine kinase [Candidatus Bathyarchaeota archaeon]
MPVFNAMRSRGGARNCGNKKVLCAMTIAGSDSGGGAGVEADLKAFSALGVFGTCVITAVTAQNTRGVRDIFPVPPEIVGKQIEAVMEDFHVQVTKTGMLYSREIMEVVSESVGKYGLKVVVDPVLRAGTGDSLIFEKDREALIELILSRAYMLTPNVPEAEMITNMRIENLEDMKKAARKIVELGPQAVIIKGGHLKSAKEKIYDVFYHGGEFKVFEKARINVEPHGGGCTFSAAITAFLARGAGLAEAVEKAEEFIEVSIRHALKVGGGRTPVNPMAHLYNESERFRVLDEVAKAAETIESHMEFLPFIAEVGTQVAMALPYPSSEENVAAIEGRIVKFHGGPKAAGSAQFGASRHIAGIILTAMRHNPEFRAALNLHYDPRLIEAFGEAGFKVASFDRRQEPAKIKSVEGASLSWGTEEAIKGFGGVPDVIFDEGEIGKEPMIRVLGRTATEAVNKALKSIKKEKKV